MICNGAGWPAVLELRCLQRLLLRCPGWGQKDEQCPLQRTNLVMVGTGVDKTRVKFSRWMQLSLGLSVCGHTGFSACVWKFEINPALFASQSSSLTVSAAQIPDQTAVLNPKPFTAKTDMCVCCRQTTWHEAEDPPL